MTGVQTCALPICLAAVDLLAKNSVALAYAKRGVVQNTDDGGIHPLLIIIPLIGVVAVAIVLYLHRVNEYKRKRAARRRAAVRRDKNVGTTTKGM